MSVCRRVKEPLFPQKCCNKDVAISKMAPVEKQNVISYISDGFWYVWELFARTNIRHLRNVNIFNVSNYIHGFLGGGVTKQQTFRS